MLRLKVADLAHAIGVEPTSYRRFERGERRIYLDKALILASQFNCTIEELSAPPTLDEKIAALKADEADRALLARVESSGLDPETLTSLDNWDDDTDAPAAATTPPPTAQPATTSPPPVAQDDEVNQVLEEWGADDTDDA